MRHSSVLAFSLLALMLITLAGCSTAPPSGLTPVSPFDLNRYLGTWYEIARLENRFEEGLTEVSAQYSLQSDGGVKVINRGYDAAKKIWRQAEGKALFTGDPRRASLKVAFFWPFYGGYHVVALDEQAYRWAIVVGADRSWAWILARDRQLPPDLRAKLAARAQALGIDAGKFVWVEQREIGG